jgi:hypothetical protein
VQPELNPRPQPRLRGASLTDRPTAKYAGLRLESGITVVREDNAGKIYPLSLRTDLRNHSPSGFEWGYGGSGAAQLALAILSDAVGAEKALSCYQRFKFQVKARLPRDQWELSREDVLAWYRGHATTEVGDVTGESGGGSLSGHPSEPEGVGAVLAEAGVASHG